MSSGQDKIIAVHQPNLFPWLGYFDKVSKADVFIHLDHVLNNPRDAIWTKRVKILVNGGPHWLTFALKRDPDKVYIPINQMEIDQPALQAVKHLKTIEENYKKTDYFREVFPYIEAFYMDESPLISERNIAFIESICGALNIDTPRKRSSLLDCSRQATDLLIELCKKSAGNIYMPGGGAGGYQEDEKFIHESIEVRPQNFIALPYPQFRSREFVPGLSILDALMNIGLEGVRKILAREKK